MSNAVSLSTMEARLVDVVADVGPYGPRWTWWFEAESATGPMKLRTWTSRHLHPNSRAGRFVARLLGRTPGPHDSIDPTALIGRDCVLVVESDAKGFLLIRSVEPNVDDMPL